MSRHRSRHRAVQVLYQCDLRRISAEEAIRNYYGGLYTEETEDAVVREAFMEELVQETAGKRELIDGYIERASENWRVERMPAVDRNILRMAVFELLQGKLPAPVVIDEALELARRFSGEESVAFLNGVLDGVRKELALPPGPTSGADSAPEE
jgi:transcription antitermination protein NusB